MHPGTTQLLRIVLVPYLTQQFHGIYLLTDMFPNLLGQLLHIIPERIVTQGCSCGNYGDNPCYRHTVIDNLNSFAFLADLPASARHLYSFPACQPRL